MAFRLAAPEVALALHVGDAVDVYAVDGASGGAPPLARDLVVRTPPRTDGLLVLGADEAAAAALAPVAARTRVTVTLHVTDP